MSASPGRPSSLYSEVVAGRNPSALKEASSAAVAHPGGGPEPEALPTRPLQPDEQVVPTVSRDNRQRSEEDTSVGDNVSPKDPGEPAWTTVERRRARSFESFDLVRSHSGSNGRKGLTLEQAQTVNAAADALTKSQKAALSKRHKKVTHHRNGSSSSRGEGASRPKGKGIDPREWGNVNISRESLDVDAQDAAWKSLAHGSNPEPLKEAIAAKGAHQRDRRSQSVRLPATSRPVAQLAQDSYLGVTLRNVGRTDPEKPHRPRKNRSPSPSDPSSPSGEDSSSDSEASSRERSHKRRNNKHGRNRRRRRRSSDSSPKMVIKPIAPREYDGSPSARAYHRFVRESEAYLRDGKVRGSRRIFLLSHYLSKKAYDFYTQRVANHEADWSLSQFYDELFNYCFPVDYRMQIRRDLARCYQNDKSVIEYTHELTELFNMIGDISERDQVLKFWNGVRPVIQKGLWRDNLNPEVSSWDSVVSQAEIIEISENVAERRDRRSGQSSQQGQSSGSQGGGSNRSKSRKENTSVSARSVSYDAKNHTHNGSGSRGGSQHGASGTNSRSSTPRGRDGSQSSRGGYSSRGRSQTPRSTVSGHSGAPRLSDKEKAERIAAGQCFVCGGTDHYSRDCPSKRTVKSSNGKAPGASSFNIEPTVEEQDSDDVEVLEGLPLGSMSFDNELPELESDPNEVMDVPPWPLDQWRDLYPFWGRYGILARLRIGDSYLMVAIAILTLSQPYPGDERYPLPDMILHETRPEARFRMTSRKSVYQIYDAFVGEEVSIEKDLLKNPRFNLARWYAVRRAQALTLDKKVIGHYKGPMGHAVSEVARKLLTDGIHTYYPGVRPDQDPRTRFEICQRVTCREEFLITDKDLRIHVTIPRDRLEDQTFDLVGWYIEFLSRRELYYPSAQTRSNSVDSRADSPCCPHDHLYVGCSQPDSEDQNPGAEGLIDHNDHVEADVYDDMPDLEPVVDDDVWDGSYVSDDEDEDPRAASTLPDEVILGRLSEVLTECQPYPGDGVAVDSTYREGDDRFVITKHGVDLIEIYDRVQGFESHISMRFVQWQTFSIGRWFAERCAIMQQMESPWQVAQDWQEARRDVYTTMGFPALRENYEYFAREVEEADELELGGVQVDRNRYPSLQRNSAQVKGNHRILPKPVVVKIEINGHPVRALLDSGSLGDFISSTLIDQLSITRETLDSPLALHLAVQGSRSKVNARATVNLKYQEINESRTLDIINLNNYDVILGTPWMYQHEVCLGFNPARVVIGRDVAGPLKAGPDTKLMVSMLTPEEREIEAAREELRQYADPICREVWETDLPPFRAINHTIPLIDESKIYSWRPSKCPEKFRDQWAEKRDAYLKSGRWEITASGNTVPMLLIPKLNTKPPELRTVVDLRERNKNTHRMTSPLPDMEGVLRRTAKHKYRSMLDMKNAYEQIRVIPEHVSRTAVTTPDGNMVSHVVQLGDCNAPATCQTLMNYLFSPYIGRFLDIYMDDIAIYSDTLGEHVEHVKLVIDILREEKLYLSRRKLYFIQSVLKLLGRIVDDQGIRMDPDKVDSVLK